MNDKWVEWLRAVTDGDSSRVIAEKVSRSHSTVLRWMHSDVPPEVVMTIALAYNADIVSSLVAVGWLRKEDLAELNLEDTLQALPTVRLTAELHRRALLNYRQHKKRV